MKRGNDGGNCQCGNACDRHHGEIASASDEQSRGIDQVGLAVAEMDRVTQQNAALVEESATAAVALEEQAARLTQTVAVFKV